MCTGEHSMILSSYIFLCLTRIAVYEMSTVTITHLYNLLSDKVGKESAEILTAYIEEKVWDEINNKALALATKEDVAKLDTKISDTKADMINWMLIFWIGQVAVTFGFILLFLRK